MTKKPATLDGPFRSWVCALAKGISAHRDAIVRAKEATARAEETR